MFKTLNIYRVPADVLPSLAEMEEAAKARTFEPCTPSQEVSVGWVDPRGTGADALVESIAGQRIMKLMIETKTVPGATLRKKAQEAADHIEATTDRKPGKKEMKELRDDAHKALLPAAFPRQSSVLVWFDVENRLMMTDASSQGKTDEVITALVRTFDNLVMTHLQTHLTPVTAMTMWLSSDENAEQLGDLHNLSIGRACELQSADEERARVSFKNHHLQTPDIRKHLTEGKLPTSLALSWEGRVAFTLTEGVRLQKITFLDRVFEDAVADKNDGFDADVAIATGELRKLIPALVGALGGEMLKEAQEADQ